jgi:hypothetical protein
MRWQWRGFDEGQRMPDHKERPASALAHGPAKSEDIERSRRDVAAAEDHASGAPEVKRAVREMEAACETIREDLDELKRTVAAKAPG